jgi:lipopolysaccharide transport system ATP-binding protein
VGSASEAIKHYFLLHQGARGVAPPAVPASTDETLAVAGARVIARPKPESLLDLTGKAQVGNGQAKCTAIALSDAAGEPCNAFRQGDTAVFHYEFELSEPIEVPVCGMVMLNDRGVIVHGKNSWQYDDDVPVTFGPGSKVSCRHEVQLNLGPGEYTFEVGLVSVAAADWQRREQLSHEEATSRSIRVCHVPKAGFFSVGLAMKNGVAVLTHHGIADLPGSMTISAVPADSVMHDAANAQRVREPEQS